MRFGNTKSECTLSIPSPTHVGLLLNPLETNGVLSKTCRLSQVKKHNSQPKKQQNTDTMAPPSRRPPAARIQQVNRSRSAQHGDIIFLRATNFFKHLLTIFLQAAAQRAG